MNKLKVFEAFAGIGTQKIALDRLGSNIEYVGISEIDKYAIESYKAIHGEVNNFGDISKIKIEELPDIDLFTYSFPCTDISIAGRLEGLSKGTGTRSSLLWDCYRIIDYKKPKYLLMENVKNLLSKKFKPHFEEWCKSLENIGYKNYYKVLNSKDFNIPQNRERIFMVSILGKDSFEFPEPIKLTKKLKDIIENNVDEKYYLDKYLNTFKNCNCSDKDIKVIGNVNISTYESINRIYSIEGISPTITTMSGGNRKPKILINKKIRKLTPKECWKLMDIPDEMFNKVRKFTSDAQLYKQSGNAIVVSVLENIFKKLLCNN